MTKSPNDIIHHVPLNWENTHYVNGKLIRVGTQTPFGSYNVGKDYWEYNFQEYYDEDTLTCDSIEEGMEFAQKDWNERGSPIIDDYLRGLNGNS